MNKDLKIVIKALNRLEENRGEIHDLILEKVSSEDKLQRQIESEIISIGDSIEYIKSMLSRIK
jgi:hypothetical protein